MRQTCCRLSKDPPQRLPQEPAAAVTDAEFTDIANRALWSALELMAACTGDAAEAVLKRYVAYSAGLVELAEDFEIFEEGGALTGEHDELEDFMEDEDQAPLVHKACAEV